MDMKIQALGHLVKTIPIKPNFQVPKGVKQNSHAGCQRSDVCLLPSVLRPLFPDEAVFSFDLVARPVILNPNIR